MADTAIHNEPTPDMPTLVEATNDHPIDIAKEDVKTEVKESLPSNNVESTTTSTPQDTPGTTTTTSSSVYDKHLPKNNPFTKHNETVNHHIFWENPVHSGTSLALILFVLIFNLFFSVFNVGAFICMIATATGVGYFILMNAFHGVFGGSADHPFEGYHRSAPYQITREQADAFFEEVLSAVNIILIELQRVVFVESLGTSTKAFIFFFLAWLITFMPINVVLILLVIAAYTLPLGYTQNKELIDANMQTAQSKAKVHMDKGMEIGRQKAYEAWSKAQNALADRNVTIPGLGKVKRTEEIQADRATASTAGPSATAAPYPTSTSSAAGKDKAE